ncbi:hypothetical protein C0J52_26306 [Blattella germanica]|nr:hypothetical protein C0J52_26306 [Blattella germanica]
MKTKRNSPSFVTYSTLQVLNVSTLGDTADINVVIQLSPYTLQHVTANHSHGRSNPVAKFLKVSREWRHIDVLHKAPQEDSHVKVNRHNVRLWGTENPHCVLEHVRDSPKVNLFCAISKNKVYGSFFFVNQASMGWFTNEDSNDCVFQQDGCPCHYHNNMRAYLNQHLPHRSIGRTGHDNALMIWSPRSLDLTPCDFFLWGFVKDNVYVPPLLANLQKLRHQIRAAMAIVNCAMLEHA